MNTDDDGEFLDVADRSKLIRSSEGQWRDDDRLVRFHETFPERDPAMQDLYRNVVIVAFSLGFLSLGFVLGQILAR